MAPPDVEIDELSEGADAEVRELLVELALEEQRHYAHPPETDAEIRSRLRTEPAFAGENHFLVARQDGRPVGLCWVVLFDPGTGLEAEIAELYVRPELRGGGVASGLVDRAVELIRARHVTFASVWTRAGNRAALAAYMRAGFRPTEQTVLTWLPLDDRGP